jgi:DNA-binding CsgD family transcriptional regulator
MKKSLSKREEQILKLILAEYSQNEICKLLDLSYSRVSDVKSIVMEKWGVKTMIGLVKESIKRGYLELEEDTFEESNDRTLNQQFIYDYKGDSDQERSIRA